MILLVSKANLLLLESDATSPAKMRRRGVGVGGKHVPCNSIGKARIEPGGFDAGSVVPRNVQIWLDRLRC